MACGISFWTGWLINERSVISSYGTGGGCEVRVAGGKREARAAGGGRKV